MEGSGYLIEDNRVEGSIGRGIGAHGSNNRVLRNRVSRNGWPEAIAASGDVIDNTIDGTNALLVNSVSYAIQVQDAPGAQVSGNVVRGVNITDGFSSHSIRVLDSPGSTVAGNHLVSSVSGEGTAVFVNDSTGGPGSFCVDNTAAGFDTALFGCTGSGNASH